MLAPSIIRFPRLSLAAALSDPARSIRFSLLTLAESDDSRYSIETCKIAWLLVENWLLLVGAIARLTFPYRIKD
jgi:hypothetical protein